MYLLFSCSVGFFSLNIRSDVDLLNLKLHVHINYRGPGLEIKYSVVICVLFCLFRIILFYIHLKIEYDPSRYNLLVDGNTAF